MLEYIRKNRDNLRNASNVFIGLLSIISTIISLRISLCGDDLSNGYMILLILIFLLLLVWFISVYSNVKLKNRWNGLILLAHRGHIQTIRMILMRDYQFKHLENEAISNGINKTNDFCMKKADFSFEVSKRDKDKKSDIHYFHRFIFGAKVKGNNVFNPWMFGENKNKPENCYVKIDKNNDENIILYPYAVKNLYIDYPVEESIYAVECSLDSIEKNEEILFSYIRRQSYGWSNYSTFVIYPKCYAYKIKKARFICKFQDDVTERISIRLTELYCNGRGVKEIINREIITVYKTSEIKSDNIYIIRINEVDNVQTNNQEN